MVDTVQLDLHTDLEDLRHTHTGDLPTLKCQTVLSSLCSVSLVDPGCGAAAELVCRPLQLRHRASVWHAGKVSVLDPTAEFTAHRGRMFGLAYRMLGSAMDVKRHGNESGRRHEVRVMASAK